MKALLLSGGMDSSSIAWWKRPDIAIFVDYGQLAARAEEEASKSICAAANIRHEMVSADCSALGSGNMSHQRSLEISPVPEWWPYRNQLILTLAAAAALRLGATGLMIGALSTDEEHVDGQPRFISAISDLMAMQEGGLTITAPAITMNATELVKASGIPQSVLAWSHSCHIGNFACGRCRGCIKHYQTWKSLGWPPH